MYTIILDYSTHYTQQGHNSGESVTLSALNSHQKSISAPRFKEVRGFDWRKLKEFFTMIFTHHNTSK